MREGVVDVKAPYRFAGRDHRGWYLWESDDFEDMTCPESYFWASAEERVRLKRLHFQAQFGLPAGRQTFSLWEVVTV